MAFIEFFDGNSWRGVRDVYSMVGAVEGDNINGTLVNFLASILYIPGPNQSFEFMDFLETVGRTWKTTTFSFKNPYEFTVPEDGTSAKMIVQSLNVRHSGFQWVHEFLPTDINPQGTYKLQSRKYEVISNAGTITDTDIFRINNDNSITFLTTVHGIAGSGGGDITTSQITDFNSAVSGFRLDQFALPNADIDLNNYRIKNLPQSPQEDLDAISATFLWDMMHDEVEITW